MVKEIQLSHNKVALVDDEDFEWLNQIKWYAMTNGLTWYAVTSLNGKYAKMHRYVFGEDKRVDHIDGDGLNNTRANLREATTLQNSWNRRKPRQLSRGKETSQFKGVAKATKYEWWYSRLVHNYKEYYLGCFRTQEEAARAYDRKATELFGEYAKLNFPEEAKP